MTLTDLVVEHAAAVTFSSLPPAAISRAKVRLLDSLGLIAAGRRALGSAEAINLVRAWGGAAEATVYGTADRVPAMHAAFANAIQLRSYDFEPVGADRADGRQVPAHITGTTVPVALAVGEATGATGEEILTALIVGDDLAARLGHAVGFDVYSGGDNTGTINALGGVVIAAKLLGMDAAGMRRALGLAINQLGGTIDNINDKTLAFKLPIALSARNAIFSAQLAAAGFDGPSDPLGGRFGFLGQWSTAPNPEAITEGLGEAYFADAVIKPWPACRASQPSIDAALRLRDRAGLRPEQIERVLVHVNRKTKRGFVGQPFTVGNALEVSGAFSIHFGVAAALLSGAVGFAQLTGEYMASPQLRGMLEKIALVDSLPDDAAGTAEVAVHTRDGEEFRERVAGAAGDIHFTPLSTEQIHDKFAESIRWAHLAPEVGEQLRERVARFETLDSLAGLPELFVAA